MPHNHFKFNRLYSIARILLALTLYIVSTCYASAIKVTASNIAKIPVQEQRNLWHHAIASPIDDYHYYIAHSNGDIYLADARQSVSSLMLDTASRLDKHTFIELTGFTLHPSFRHREQTGFLTFYTAHIERYNPRLNKKRLPKKQVKSLVNDIVVTEWKLNKNDFKNAKLSRELLRISTPDKTHKITKLAFNPYVKSWQDNFGFLYIAISKSQISNTQALYSGSILRVNTHKFGLKPYTIPQDNPFISTNNIDNEIVIITASQVSDINWIKGESKGFLVSTLSSSEQSVFLSKLGDDWRSTKPAPLQTIETSKNTNTGMFYFGRNLNRLWQHYFTLIPANDGWQMSATSGLLTKVGTGLNSEHWQIDDRQLSQEPELSLFPDHQGEPLVFASASGKLYRLFIIDEQTKATTVDETNQVSQRSNYSVVIITTVFVLLLSAPMVYLVIRRIRQKQQSIRHQYTRMVFDSKSEQIEVYRPRQDQPSIELTVTDITESSVYLNDIKLASINSTNVFNNDVQDSIEDALAREYRHKMVDDKIRKIEVSINTKTNKEHIVCLYLRKGNRRITKNSYDDSLLFLFDWCWFISQKLHPNAKIARKLKLPVEPVTPVTKKPSPPPKAEPAVCDSIPSSETVVQQSTIAEHTLKPVNEKTSIDQDAELVHALEKLIKFKEQGILTDEEFNQAKAKLLKDLIQN